MAYIHHTTFHTENAILYGIFHVMHEMRLLMPITRVLTDSLTHANAKCENQSLMFHLMTFFPKQKLFFFIIQNPLDKLRYSLFFTMSRVFLWVANFRGVTAGFACLPTLSRTFIVEYICLTKNKIWFFHHRGDLPHLASPKLMKFIIIILGTRESQFWTLSQFPSSLHIHQEW